jgi:DNA excision repair protein ERCC-3
MYVLATQGSREEEFARRRMRHLAEKGVRVTETTVESGGIDDTDGDGSEHAESPAEE